MQILACFKVVPDLDQMPAGDWLVDDRFRVETGYVKNMLNPYDESALEITLRYADQARRGNLPLNLTALTIGSKQADTYLKTLYALRYDKAVRVASDRDIRFLPEIAAAVISEYAAEKNRADVLIMGMQSGVGDNAKTPLLTAEYLNWPCITGVVAIEPANNGTKNLLKVKSMVDSGILEQTVRPPLVLAVSNAPGTYLRVPTLKDKVEYGKKPVEVQEMDNFKTGLAAANTSGGCRLTGLKPINHRREGLIIDGETAAEKARILYHSYLRERLGKL